MAKISVGIVGAGLAGIAHGRGYAKIDSVRVVGVFDTQEDRGRDLARSLGADCFPSLEELLDSGIDAVSICTPHCAHEEATIAAAAAGKHILLEKPIAVTVEQGERMLKACRDNAVKLMMGMTHRFYPEFIEAKRLVDEGAIGQIYMVLDRTAMANRDFVPWVFERKIAGGGVWMDNGIHNVDRLRWFLASEVAEVTAHVGTFAMAADTEDNGAALFRFQNGAFASVVQIVSPGSPLESDMELYGSEGSMKVATWKGLTLATGDKSYTQVCRPNMINLWDGITPGIVAEVRKFVRCLEEDLDPPATGQDGLEDLKVILAVYESSETGRKVVLERRK